MSCGAHRVPEGFCDFGGASSSHGAVVLATAAFVVSPASVTASGSTRHFRASAVLLAVTGKRTSTTNLSQDALLMTIGVVPRRAAEQLHVSGNPARLVAQVKTAIDLKVQTITISTRQPTAARASMVANTFAEQLVAYLRDVAKGQFNLQVVAALSASDDAREPPGSAPTPARRAEGSGPDERDPRSEIHGVARSAQDRDGQVPSVGERRRRHRPLPLDRDDERQSGRRERARHREARWSEDEGVACAASRSPLRAAGSPFCSTASIFVFARSGMPSWPSGSRSSPRSPPCGTAVVADAR